MPYKPYVLTLEPEKIDWLKRTSKTLKMKPSVLGRAIIDYMIEFNVDELKKNLTKSQIENLLNEAETRAKIALAEKERLEHELEELNA